MACRTAVVFFLYSAGRPLLAGRLQLSTGHQHPLTADAGALDGELPPSAPAAAAAASCRALSSCATDRREGLAATGGLPLPLALVRALEAGLLASLALSLSWVLLWWVLLIAAGLPSVATVAAGSVAGGAAASAGCSSLGVKCTAGASLPATWVLASSPLPPCLHPPLPRQLPSSQARLLRQMKHGLALAWLCRARRAALHRQPALRCRSRAPGAATGCGCCRQQTCWGCGLARAHPCCCWALPGCRTLRSAGPPTRGWPRWAPAVQQRRRERRRCRRLEASSAGRLAPLLQAPSLRGGSAGGAACRGGRKHRLCSRWVARGTRLLSTVIRCVGTEK